MNGDLMMKQQDLAYFQGEIAAELRRRGLTDMQAILISQWITEQIVTPAIQHELARVQSVIGNFSLTKTETLGEVGLLDRLSDSIR